MRKHRLVEDRFFDKVVAGPNGCWIWTGAGGNGYGRFFLTDTRRMVQAHRWSYEFHFGLLQDGVTVDHLCRTKLCVNPAHLEPVTNQENVRRWAATITHCPQGHPYDEENTYVCANGKRSCRTCQRALRRVRDLSRVLTPEQRARKNARERKRRAAQEETS